MNILQQSEGSTIEPFQNYYMQSKIFQAFICYNFDDYGLQLMKNLNSKLQYCEKVFISVIHNHQNHNK